jgi:hypothetical protein
MLLSDRKSRMVSFRLSPAEYEAAVNHCRTQGYRSLSLYARSALLAFESSPHPCSPQAAEMAEIRLRLESLTAEMERIAATVPQPPGDSLSFMDANVMGANSHNGFGSHGAEQV